MSSGDRKTFQKSVTHRSQSVDVDQAKGGGPTDPRGVTVGLSQCGDRSTNKRVVDSEESPVETPSKWLLNPKALG
jgi:hypothetical protein